MLFEGQLSACGWPTPHTSHPTTSVILRVIAHRRLCGPTRRIFLMQRVSGKTFKLVVLLDFYS
jgi:hypothetical protein